MTSFFFSSLFSTLLLLMLCIHLILPVDALVCTAISAIWYSCQRRKVFDPDDNQRTGKVTRPIVLPFLPPARVTLLLTNLAPITPRFPPKQATITARAVHSTSRHDSDTQQESWSENLARPPLSALKAPWTIRG